MPPRRRSTRFREPEDEDISQEQELAHEQEQMAEMHDQPTNDQEDVADEYMEEDEEEEDPEADVTTEIVEEEVEHHQPKRRGRPPGSKNKVYDGETITPRKRGRPPSKNGPAPPRPPKASKNHPVTQVPLDENGVPQTILNDEVDIPDDPDGETKIQKNGELLGGRDYRVRTFTAVGRGDRLYMLSTEPARCMGFRDSYLLFQKHRKLYKIILNEREKFDLINREIIPHSYKGRAIGIVTARSVFREFGSRIVIGGKRVVDDYYEQQARDQGFVPGEIADKDDKLPPEGTPYNKNQYVAWHGASSVYHQYNAPAPMMTRDTFRDLSSLVKKKKVNITDENWMYEHALASSQYNTELLKKRRKNFKGVYEGHTGVNFYPKNTQPEVCKWAKVGASGSTDGKVIIEAVSVQKNPYPRTGLIDVPPSVYEHLPDDIKQAIVKQQAFERQWS